MKDIYFSQLEVGENVWVVYNKNYDNKDLPYKKILVKGKIIENHAEDRKIDISDRWEDPVYRIDHEYLMKISVEGLSNEYMRFYSDFYDKKGQMSMSPEYNDHGPWIEIFSTKKNAIEYVNEWCNTMIKRLENTIKKAQEEIEINKKCIDSIKNI